jgi:hypothetical protein
MIANTMTIIFAVAFALMRERDRHAVTAHEFFFDALAAFPADCLQAPLDLHHGA